MTWIGREDIPETQSDQVASVGHLSQTELIWLWLEAQNPHLGLQVGQSFAISYQWSVQSRYSPLLPIPDFSHLPSQLCVWLDGCSSLILPQAPGGSRTQLSSLGCNYYLTVYNSGGKPVVHAPQWAVCISEELLKAYHCWSIACIRGHLGGQSQNMLCFFACMFLMPGRVCGVNVLH